MDPEFLPNSWGAMATLLHISINCCTDLNLNIARDLRSLSAFLSIIAAHEFEKQVYITS